MTKNELIVRTAARLEMETEEAAPYVEAFMQVALDAIGRGDRIEIRDFGVYQIVERRPRKARNPRTGESVQVGVKRTVKFKPGKALQDRVREAGFKVKDAHS